MLIEPLLDDLLILLREIAAHAKRVGSRANQPLRSVKRSLKVLQVVNVLKILHERLLLELLCRLMAELAILERGLQTQQSARTLRSAFDCSWSQTAHPRAATAHLV